MQDIRQTGLCEGYRIVPLRGGQRNSIQGVTFLVNNHVFPYFLEQSLAPVNTDVVDIVAPRYAVGFTPFTDCSDASSRGFGFGQGIRLGPLMTRDWVSHTQVHVLFQKARTMRRLGWPGYSFVLNVNWILRSLQQADYPAWDGERAQQLFALMTGFSGGIDDSNFPVTVTVGQTAAAILRDIAPNSFSKAEQVIADVLDWFRGPQAHNLMSVRAGRNGTLRIDQEPYSLGLDPSRVEPGAGYQIFSDNVQDPVGQIVLLVGLASIWEELARCSVTTAA